MDKTTAIGVEEKCAACYRNNNEEETKQHHKVFLILTYKNKHDIKINIIIHTSTRKKTYQRKTHVSKRFDYVQNDYWHNGNKSTLID
jgi:hypothetical protein